MSPTVIDYTNRFVSNNQWNSNVNLHWKIFHLKETMRKHPCDGWSRHRGSITFDEMWYTNRNALTFTLTHCGTHNTSKIPDKICTQGVWLTIIHILTHQWRQQSLLMDGYTGGLFMDSYNKKTCYKTPLKYGKGIV